MSTSPRSDVIQWHDRSKIQLLEHIASLEKEVSIESQRATHYREQWQISILAFKEQENSIRSLCENSRRYESDAEASKQHIKRLEEAGDAVMKSLSCGCPHGPSVFHCQTCTNSWQAWNKAKEDKP